MAAIGPDPNLTLESLGASKGWLFWQYTSSGKVSGISGNVDLNRFDSTIKDLKRISIQPPLMPEPTLLDLLRDVYSGWLFGKDREGTQCLLESGQQEWLRQYRLTIVAYKSQQPGQNAFSCLSHFMLCVTFFGSAFSDSTR